MYNFFMRILFVLALLLSPFQLLAENSTEKNLFTNESGFIVCNGGGTNNPLFSKDCSKITIQRVSAGGGIKYEGNCIDSNGITFFLACDAINFEYTSKQNENAKPK